MTTRSQRIMPRPTSFAIALVEGVATFTLERVGRKNALTKTTYQELRDAFQAAADDDAISAVVLTGAGGDFCAGGDVREVIADLVDGTQDDLNAWNRLTADTVAAMRALPKPIIAAIDGVAAGGGAALALAADLRIGTDRARFGFLFRQVGLSAADMGVTWLLPRLVGAGRAAELIYFGDFVDAGQALSLGLLNRVVPQDACLPQAIQWAHRLGAGPRLAFATNKRMLDATANMTWPAALDAEIEAQTRCMQHPDFREGYQAFIEKRPPRWDR